MTALRKPTKRLQLRARRRDEVARPIPFRGDHNQIVKKARLDAYTKHPEVYRELSKI